MPDKLTDSEIVKALECCCEAEIKEDCEKLKCPFFDNEFYNCMTVDDEDAMYRYALDLINRLQAENERLKKGWKADVIETANVKAEAYKEFAERLKEKSKKTEIVCSGALITTSYAISSKNLEILLKELVGE